MLTSVALLRCGREGVESDLTWQSGFFGGGSFANRQLAIKPHYVNFLLMFETLNRRSARSNRILHKPEALPLKVAGERNSLPSAATVLGVKASRWPSSRPRPVQTLICSPPVGPLELVSTSSTILVAALHI